MSKTKYNFIKQPEEGKFGEWLMMDGFQCYTDNRATAVRWYKQYLKTKTII